MFLQQILHARDLFVLHLRADLGDLFGGDGRALLPKLLRAKVNTAAISSSKQMLERRHRHWLGYLTLFTVIASFASKDGGCEGTVGCRYQLRPVISG